MADTNNKISLIVGSQLPAFVQDDYPTFVAFLEAYYEYLEQQGKLLWAQNVLEHGFDVDDTLDEFLAQFKNEYLAGFPADMLADKALMIKNIKQFYLSKGSEKSLKFLFRALFGEDILIVYPNRSILKVSDGKWLKETALRITGNILNLFTGDGNTAAFILSDAVNSEANLFVTINGSTISPNSYSYAGSTLTMSANIANGDVLSVSIDGGDYNKFVGKQVFGQTSGAAAIVEKYKRVYDKGQFYNELTITDLSKNFEVGENAYTFWTDDVNNVSIKIAVPITSSVIDVEIITGGAFYNVGDPLIFTSNSGSGAQAFIASIYKSGVRSLEVLAAGAGFKPGVLFDISGGGGTGAAILLNGVDATGSVHPNTYNVTAEIIQTYANTNLGSGNYGFPAFANGNVNTLLSQAFTYQAYGLCGPIDPTQVLIIQEGQDYITLPSISLGTPIFQVNTSNIRMTDFGILGATKIYNAGSGYSVGDEVVFTNVIGSTGQDGAAAVTAISATGGISKIEFQFPRIGGTVNIAAGSNVVFGTGTAFQNNVIANATIIVNNEIKVVQSVTNTNNMIIVGTWTNSAVGKKLGVKGRNFIGGSGYHMTQLPTVSISSGGANANVVVTAVIGDGEDVRVSSLQPVGRIKTIHVTQGGRDYIEAPHVDLSMTGDGSANVLAQIAGGMFEYPGVFKNEDGFPSGSNKLHDRDFYQFYSYVIKSTKTLDKYESTLKALVHPVGMKYFAEVDRGTSLVDVTPVMSHYDFILDYKYIRLLIAGSALVTKRMNYVVIPNLVRVAGITLMVKLKKVPYSGNAVKVAGTHGPVGAEDFIFSAPLITSLVPDRGNGSATFARAGSNTATVTDWEGLVRYTAPNEARFAGARRVQNLATPNSESTASWTPAGNTTIVGNIFRLPASAPGDLVQRTFTFPDTNTPHFYVGSVTLSSNTPVNLFLTIRDGSGGGGGGVFSRKIYVQKDAPYRFTSAGIITSITGLVGLLIADGGTGVSANVTLSNYQIERYDGSMFTMLAVSGIGGAPSEYVSNGVIAFPYHGAGVDGVKYFSGPNRTVVAGLTGIANSNSAYLSGSHIAFPNTLNSRVVASNVSGNTFTSQIDIRALVSWDNANSAAYQGIATSGGPAIRFYKEANDSRLTLDINSGGTLMARMIFPGIPVSNGTPIGVRATYDGLATTRLYYGPTIDGPWTEGPSSQGTFRGPIGDALGTIKVGDLLGNWQTVGRIYRVIVSREIGGPPVLDMNPAEATTPHITGFSWNSRSTGETWTPINGARIQHGLQSDRLSWLELPGQIGEFANTPDSPQNSLTGDLDIRVTHALTSTGSPMYLFAKDHSAGGRHSWAIVDNGTLQYSHSADGSNQFLRTSAPHFAPAGQLVTYRVTHQMVGNTVNFYKSFDFGESWILISTDVGVGTSAIFDSVSNVSVGAGNDNGNAQVAKGKILRAQLLNGINGPVVVDFNPMLCTPGANSFVSHSGETWTIRNLPGGTGYIPAAIRESFTQNSSSYSTTLAGYMSEELRLNILFETSNIANTVAGWTTSFANLAANFTTAPDGTQAATKITASDTSTGAGHTVSQTLGYAYPTTFSVYAKPAGYNYLVLAYNGLTLSFARQIYDVANGIMDPVTSNSISGGFGLLGASITPAGNGWFRCTLSAAADGSTKGFSIGISNSSNVATFPAPDTTNGVAVWGAQAETANCATSYIPNYGPTRNTRNPDVLTFPSANNVVGGNGKAYAEVGTCWSAIGPAQATVLDLGVNRSPLFVDNLSGNVSLHDGSGLKKGNRFVPSMGVQALSSRWNGANGTADIWIAKVPQRSFFDGDMDVGANMTVGAANASASNNWNGTIRNLKIWPQTIEESYSTLDLYAPLINSSALVVGVGEMMFTRANTATVEDWEYKIRRVLPGEIRYKGARRVQNLSPNTENITVGGGWILVNTIPVIGASDPDGGLTAWTMTANNADASWSRIIGIGTAFSVHDSLWIRRRSGSGVVRLVVPNGGFSLDVAPQLITPLGNTWVRFNSFISPVSTTAFLGLQVRTSGDSVDFWHPQLENLQGQTNQNPSEYVSNGAIAWPYHGANVDGVKYFASQNPWVANNLASPTSTKANLPQRLAWLELPGFVNNIANTPDSPNNSITGDMDIRFFGAARKWVGASATQGLVYKWFGGTQLSYGMYLTTGGAIGFAASNNGVDVPVNQQAAGAATGLPDGSAHWMRATFQANNGVNSVTSFYRSEDGNNWLQIGSALLGPIMNIFDSTSNLTIGAQSSGGFEFAGKVYRLQIYNGINGTLAVDFNPARSNNPGSPSFVASTGETWTIQSNTQFSANAVIRDAFVMDSNTYSQPLAGYLAEAGTKNMANNSEDFANGVSWTPNNSYGLYDFFAPLDTTIVPSKFITGNGTATFTRASTATDEDWENYLRLARTGEVRFKGARRVENLISNPTESLELWANQKSGNVISVVVTANSIAPDGTTTAFRVNVTSNVTTANAAAGDQGYINSIPAAALNGRVYIRSIWAKSNTAFNQNVVFGTTAGNWSQQLITPTWTRFAKIGTFTAGTGLEIGVRGTLSDANVDVLVWHPQVEEVSGQAFFAPSDYVSNGAIAAPWHGANVDGVKYFSVPNANTMNVANNIVTQVVLASNRLAWLEMPGTIGNFANSPTSTAANSANTQLEVKWYGTSQWQNGTTINRLMAKGQPVKGWALRRSGTAFILSLIDQINNTAQPASVALPINIPSNTALWVKATFITNTVSNTANTTFYVSPDANIWLQLGATVSFTFNGAIQYGGESLTVGIGGDGITDPSQGKCYRATIANTIGGSPVIDFDPLRTVTAGDGSFTAITGEVWTVQSNTVISQNASIRDAFVQNTDTYSTPILGFHNEESRVNLVLWSENLANSTVWPQRNVTVTAAATGGPDGNVAGTKIAENANNDIHMISQPMGLIANGSTATYTVYFKQAERNWVFLGVFNRDNNVYRGWFNLANGALGSNSAGGGSIPINHEIIASTGGWYRCTLTTPTGEGSNSYTLFILPCTSDGNTSAYIGTVGSGIYAWGAQLELSSNATTYIVTGAANAARSPDSLSYPANNIPFFNVAGGASAEVVPLGQSVSGGSADARILALNSPLTNNNRWYMRYIFNDMALRGTYGTGVGATDATGSVIPMRTLSKTMFTWGNFGGLSTANGNFGTGTNSTIPVILPTVGTSVLSIGNNLGLGYHNGTIRNVRIWQRNLTVNDAVVITSLANIASNTANVVTNTVVAPDGSSSADVVSDNSTSGTVSIYQDSPVANDASIYVFSLFVKKTIGVTNYAAMALSFIGGQIVNNIRDGIVFNTNNGTIASNLPTTTGNFEAKVWDMDEFWRISLKTTNNSQNNTTLRAEFYPAFNGSGANTANVQVTGSQAIWGAQIQNASGNGYWATSYLPSTTLNGISDMDNLSVWGLNRNYYGLEGTAYAEIISGSGASSARVLGDISSAATMIFHNSSTITGAFSTGGQLPTTTAVGAKGEVHKLTSTWSNSANVLAVWNNGTGRANTIFTVGISVSNLGFGIGATQSGVCSVRNAKVWRRALSNAQVALVNFPLGIGTPTLSFDFTQNTVNSIVGGITPTFVRQSVGTRVNSAGFIEVLSANTPRYDYDPVTRTHRGLILEQIATNVCLWSEDLTNAAWSKTNVTISSNANTAPDGSSNADGIIPNNGVLGGFVNQNPTFIAAPYTLSAYLKFASVLNKPWVEITLSAGASTYRTWFNTQTGVKGTSSGGPSAYSIEDAGNGWYRCTITATMTNVSGSFFIAPRDGDGNSSGVTGNGVNPACYVWGAQLEQASFMTTYIPTTSATVLRDVDAFTVSSNSWISANQGSVFCEFQHSYIPIGALIPGIWSINNGGGDRIGMRRNDSGGGIAFAMFANSVSQPFAAGRTFNDANVHKSIVTWKPNESLANFDGGTELTSTANAISPFGMTQLQLGTGIGFNGFNGRIKTWRYYGYFIPYAFTQNMAAFF